MSSQTPYSTGIRNKNNYTTWHGALVCAYLSVRVPARCGGPVLPTAALAPLSPVPPARTPTCPCWLAHCCERSLFVPLSVDAPLTTQLPRKKKIPAGSSQLKDTLASTEKREQRAGDPQPSRPTSEHSAKSTLAGPLPPHMESTCAANCGQREILHDPPRRQRRHKGATTAHVKDNSGLHDIVILALVLHLRLVQHIREKHLLHGVPTAHFVSDECTPEACSFVLPNTASRTPPMSFSSVCA